MDISCVILTWNSEKYILRCLESLLIELQENLMSYEIFIVDNGSKDHTVEVIDSFKEKYPLSIFPIYLGKNMGTTVSRNLALKRAIGDFIIIMDSDIEVKKGAIKPLLKAFKDYLNVGIVAPKLLYPAGRVQKSADQFPTIFNKLRRYLLLKWMENKEQKKQLKYLTEVDYAISAMWVLNRDVLNKVGFLDEAIFYAPEDVDYCLRTWLSGNRVFYCPEVEAIHHTQEASRGFKINHLTIEHIKGLVYFFWKHKYIFRRPKRPIITSPLCR